MPNESLLPILWEDKVNSPELEAWFAQFGVTGYLNAEQINQLRDAINELFFNSVGSSGDGNIKPRLIYIPYFDEPTLAHFAARINAEPSFTIIDGQLPVFYLFHLTFEAIAKPSFRMFSKLGSGTYGIGGTPLAAFDLIDVIQVTASVDEIETMEGTQIIDLGEIGSANPWTVLNGKNPKLPIQNQILGYRLVKSLVSGVSVRYLFLGIGGDYGVGGLQSVAADFSIQSAEIVPIDISGKEDKSNKGIANGYAPLGADLKVPSANVSPLVGGVIFVSASGNNSTAEIENRDKPFLTINAALTAYWANAKIDYIEIISADVFTATGALNDGVSNRKIDIRSQKECVLNINTNGVYSFVSPVNQKQLFNIPFGTLNFTPTTSASFGQHPNTNPTVDINALNVFFGNKFNADRVFSITIKSDTLNLSSTSTGICNYGFVNIEVNTINIRGAGAKIVGVFNNALIDFNLLTHDNSFSVNDVGTSLNLNHGTITSVSPYTNAFISYIQVTGAYTNINYKPSANIASNLCINAFNGTGLLTLKGDVKYPNSDYLIRGINKENTIYILRANITCKKLFDYRSNKKVRINNSYFTITGSNFASTSLTEDGNTYESGTITFEGTNYIIGATPGFDLYLKSEAFTATNKPSIDTKKGTLRTNGLINSDKIDLIDIVLNEY